jgi:hypothetical protein
MNINDGTARMMTDCFTNTKNPLTCTFIPNNILLNQMNKPLNILHGKARKYPLQSQEKVFNEADSGADDAMNRILWFYAKGGGEISGGKVRGDV